MPAFGLKPIDVAAGQATAATVFLAPLALIFDKPWNLPTPNVAVMASVLAIAAFSTALAYVVYFRILAGAGATNVLLVTLLVPRNLGDLGGVVSARAAADASIPRVRADCARSRVHRRPPFQALFGVRGNPDLAPLNSRLPTGGKSR